jgi:hypothetical protein
MRAHLLPKLRCHFAEFLNQGSLKRLGIFSPPTCVGLRYGHLSVVPRSFSWKLESPSLCRSALLITSRRCPAVCGLGLLRTPYGLEPTSNIRLGYPSPSLLLQRHPSWCRNINLLPITYAFRPRLRDRLTLGRLSFPGNLGLTATGFFTRFIATHACISSSQAPAVLTVDLRQPENAPYHSGPRRIRSFGTNA